MNESGVKVVQEHLPFYITGPGETDVLFGAVVVSLVLVVVAFGAFYFTIQSVPDRMVEGTSKAQMQIVGILGLVSLFTMNNLYWIAALLLAAIRIPDFVTPLKSAARSLKRIAVQAETQPEPPSIAEPETPEPSPPEQPEPIGEEEKDD